MKVTYRSVVIGLLLTPLTCMWLELCEFQWYSGSPTSISLYSHVMVILCLIAVSNEVVRRCRPAWALQSGEMIVIYVMLSLASSIGGHDMLQVLLPSMTHLHYFGPLEGRYEEFVGLVPPWLIVRDQTAIASAYMGQESVFRMANALPWLVPLGWWFLFVMALCAVMWGLLLAFRAQWTEHEKLAFPITQTPMLVAGAPRRLVRSRAFWVAFLLTGGIDILNGLNKLYPAVPRIPIVFVMNLQTLFTERPWIDMWPAWVSFYPCVIGLCFLMPLDLAFSTWFFFFFWQAQRVTASWIGAQGMPGFPFVMEQSVGGYYALALTALWISRRHLLHLGHALVGGPVDGASPTERREARLAMAFLAAGAGFLAYFCHRANMTWYIALAFFVQYYLISIGITRMRAELGPPSHDLYPIGPHRQLVEIIGAATMRNRYPTDLAMFGLLGFFNRVYRGHPMPHGLEGFQMAGRLGLKRGPMLAAMWLAIILGTASSMFALVWILNRYGAVAQVSVLGEGLSRESWDAVHGWFTAPPRYSSGPTVAIAVGLLTALGLTVLRMNLAWWPFHPVGYAISGSWTMTWIWLCVFIAWAAKWLILKYGGSQAYKAAVPFFVGLILGDFLVGSVWNLYGILMEREVYHFYPY